MSFLSFSTIMIFLEQYVRLPHTCAPERSIYLTGNREKFQSNKKVPCITLHNTRDVCSTRFHPGYPSSCHLPATRTAKTGSSDLSFDGNGITGPDWGRSELVFNMLPAEDARSICIPLCCRLANATRLFNAFSYFTVYSSTILFKL